MQATVIKFEAGAAELVQQLFGSLPPDETLADLAGALDGATVTVSVRKIGLYLAVEHPWFECYETSVRINQLGELYAYIHDVRKRGREPKALLTQAFSRQIRGAQMLGIRYFELFAAGYFRDTSFSGYRVWPQLGFNALLDSDERGKLPLALRGVRDLNELLSQDEGYEWWKVRGTARTMFFEVNENSRMMQVFKRKLKAGNVNKE